MFVVCIFSDCVLFNAQQRGGGGGQVEARAPGRRPWRRIGTLFTVILNVFLSRNLDQSMLKNAYFLEKTVKIASPSSLASGGWGLRPQNSCVITPPTITTFSSSFLL